MRLLRWLLFPFSVVFGCITALRNLAYSRGWFYSVRFEVPTVVVGNVAVGGTGKSPMVEYVVQYYQRQHLQVATLSRGYGRQTKGFRLAGAEDTAATLGDEPMQFYRKFGGQVPVAVGEERIMAIPEILAAHVNTQVLVLDDAFQHRKLRPHLAVVLSTYQNPFYYDFMLPTGYLREGRKGTSRAQAVIITKCPPNLASPEQAHITAQVKKWAGQQVPVYFSTIAYGRPAPVPAGNIAAPQQDTQEAPPLPQQWLLVSGLANASLFEQHARQHYKVVGHQAYADHHHYKPAQVKQLLQQARQAGPGTALLLTEKDMVKWLDPALAPLWQKQPGQTAVPVYYVPIKTVFISGEAAFQQQLLSVMPHSAN